MLAFAPRTPFSSSRRPRSSPRRRRGCRGRLARLRGGGWAWILPLSLGLTIGLIALGPGRGRRLRLARAPRLPAARGVGGGARGAPPRSLTAGRRSPGGALALAWADQYHLPGQTAALALTALSCVPLAFGLARLAPRLGAQGGDRRDGRARRDPRLLQSSRPRTRRSTPPCPPPGCPRLQLVEFGSAVMGYGDLFIAAVLGAVLAAEGRRRRVPARAPHRVPRAARGTSSSSSAPTSRPPCRSRSRSSCSRATGGSSSASSSSTTSPVELDRRAASRRASGPR